MGFYLYTCMICLYILLLCILELQETETLSFLYERRFQDFPRPVPWNHIELLWKKQNIIISLLLAAKPLISCSKRWVNQHNQEDEEDLEESPTIGIHGCLKVAAAVRRRERRAPNQSRSTVDPVYHLAMFLRIYREVPALWRSWTRE